MPYLIDGHNLIPKIPGLSLDNIDDEKQLVEMLGEFCQATGKQVEVYFDNAPPGQARAQTHGAVTARFVREGQTADEAITKHLKRLAGEARNWSVVSSDRQVAAAAKAAHARATPAAEFAQFLMDTLNEAGGKSQTADTTLSDEEVNEWLDIFGETGKAKNT